MENANHHHPSPTKEDFPRNLPETPDVVDRSATQFLGMSVSENAASGNESSEVPPCEAWGTDALMRVEDSPESPGQSTVIDRFKIAPREEGPNTMPALGPVPSEPNTVLPSIDELFTRVPIRGQPFAFPQSAYSEATATRGIIPPTALTPFLTNFHATHVPVVRGPSPDITPSLAPFTDSGYESSKGGLLDQLKVSDRPSHEVKGVLSGIPVVEGSLSVPDNADGAGDSTAVTDDASVYTSNGSVASETRDTYAEVLVDDLVESVLDCPMSPENTNKVSEALPGLLKTFALSLGHCPPSQMHRDVMLFIRKYRE